MVLVLRSVALLVQLVLMARLARRVHSARLVRLVRLALLVQLALLVRLVLPGPMARPVLSDQLVHQAPKDHKVQPAPHLLLTPPLFSR